MGLGAKQRLLQRPIFQNNYPFRKTPSFPLANSRSLLYKPMKHSRASSLKYRLLQQQLRHHHSVQVSKMLFEFFSFGGSLPLARHAGQFLVLWRTNTLLLAHGIASRWPLEASLLTHNPFLMEQEQHKPRLVLPHASLGQTIAEDKAGRDIFKQQG